MQPFIFFSFKKLHSLSLILYVCNSITYLYLFNFACNLSSGKCDVQNCSCQTNGVIHFFIVTNALYPFSVKRSSLSEYEMSFFFSSSSRFLYHARSFFFNPPLSKVSMNALFEIATSNGALSKRLFNCL